VDHADVLLHQTHGIVRLDNIWGTGGGIRPVKILIKKVTHLFI
jgi:programmed cell death protein 4